MRMLVVFDSAFGDIERIGHPAGLRVARDRDAWHGSPGKRTEMNA